MHQKQLFLTKINQKKLDFVPFIIFLYYLCANNNMKYGKVSDDRTR